MNDQTNIAPETALAAMRGCDLTDPESLLDQATPEAIIDACTRWTAKRRGGENVGAGLLVSWIRRGGAPDRGKPQQEDLQTALRRRFDETTHTFPRGAAAESHSSLQTRRWPDEKPCPGRLIVTDRAYPSLTVRCDRCGTLASYPLRALLQLPRPTEKQKSVGLATDGIGTPLLTAPLTSSEREPAPNAAPAAVALENTPFAATRLLADQANQDVTSFLSAFNLAVDTEDADEGHWACQKMTEAHARLGGTYLWGAMKWAARLRHPNAARSRSHGPEDLPSFTAIAENYFKNMKAPERNGTPALGRNPEPQENP